MANVYAVILTHHPIYPTSDYERDSYSITLFTTMQLAQNNAQKYTSSYYSVEIQQIILNNVNSTIDI